jgi:O-antigen/teichoic acid export membrane protein
MTEQAGAGEAWRLLARRFAYLLGAFWFREALQALFMIYLARREAATFGQFFLGLSLGQMVLFISEFGLNQHLAVLLSRRQNPPVALLAQASLLKAGLLVLAWLGLAGLVHWQGYSPELRLVVLVLAGGLGLEALASSFYVWLQIQDRQASEGGARAGACLLGFGYGFGALYLGATAWAVAAHRLLESLAGVLICLWLSMRSLGRAAFWPGWRGLAGTWGGGLVFTAMAAAAMFYNRLNIIFLERHAGEQALAQYGVTWQLVDGLTSLVVGLLLNNVLLPRFLRLWATDRQALLELARGAAHWLLMGSLALAWVLLAASEPIISLLYGPAYDQAAELQQWLSLCVVLGIMHNLAGYLMIAMGKQNLLLMFFVVVLGFNALACAWLIPGDPLPGAVGAILASKVLLALMSLGYCQRRLGLWRGWYLVWLATTLAAGGLIFLLGQAWLGQAAAAPALLPLAWLAWRRRPGAPNEHPDAG